VTAQARITQADMDRATKAVAKACLSDRARIIMDLKNARIEIIIGRTGEPPLATGNEWDQE
jgi:hypothetical protein